MIIDTIQNLKKYTALHPLFAQAEAYMGSIAIQEQPTGSQNVAEGLKAIYSLAPGKSKETSLQKFECHDKYIDIQVCISGIETIGWKPREKCTSPNGDYNQEKDFRFFHDTPDMFFQLTSGQFVIFFPEDVHAPMIGEGDIQKLVIKVKI